MHNELTAIVEQDREWYMENLARCIIRASFSRERMTYLDREAGDEKTFRRNRARLIQKIYEVDPLVCPRYQSAMRVTGCIEDPSVIRAILEHLGLWLARSAFLAQKGIAAPGFR